MRLVGYGSALGKSESSLTEEAFTQRRAGPFTYRYATQLWYGWAMKLFKSRRVGQTMEIKSSAPGVTDPIDSVPLRIRTDTGEHGFPPDTAYLWIKQAQEDGYGVIVLPGGGPGEEVIVKTKRAAVAQELTSQRDETFVLNDPKGGWIDVSQRAASNLSFPLMFVAGFFATLLIFRGKSS